MEPQTTNQTPQEKIFKDKAFWVGTFIGGPLVAGYFLAENFKVFKEFDKVKKSWVYAILTTIIVFIISFSIPENVKVPNQLIPLIYTGLAYFLVIHFQGDKIKEHLDSGGKPHSWWRIIGISFIGLIVTTLPIIGYVYFTDPVTDFSTETRTYGIMKHEIAFDSNNISTSEIDNIAEGFRKTTYFDNAVTKYVYAKEENGNYLLYLSVIDGIENDNYALKPFNQLQKDMQKEFPDKKIIVNLVVDYLDNVVKRIE